MLLTGVGMMGYKLVVTQLAKSTKWTHVHTVLQKVTILAQRKG